MFFSLLNLKTKNFMRLSFVKKNGKKIGVTEISLFVFHSVSTRVSNELGAGHPAAAKLAGCVVMIMVAIQGMLVGTFFILIRNVWGYAFSNEQEVVEYLAKMLPIVAVSEFFSGLQNVLSGYHSILSIKSVNGLSWVEEYFESWQPE